MRHISLLKFTLLFSLAGILYLAPVEAQNNEAVATRTTGRLKINGRLSELEWKDAVPALNFIQRAPDPGKPSKFSTDVRILYDDEAIYIGARMYDPEPNKIMAQNSERDGDYNADRFEILFDPFESGINGFSISLTAANVQIDSRVYGSSNDKDWDGVWFSQTNIDSTGWVAEIKIPYAVLRFPKKEIQSWNINFFREVRRVRETSSWFEIDPNLEGLLNQCGKLTGLAGIKTPLRLALSPYSTLARRNSRDQSIYNNQLTGGMDIKLGLTDAFTLDMTLIPDFNDVQSDFFVFNLTPYEIRYNDFRPFFTEGVDLFNRGNLFYSRRIGETEFTGGSLIQQPRLLNSAKLTGRTNSGLGIGLLNATQNRGVMQFNTEELEFQPRRNFNVLVLEQSLANNSSIALINNTLLQEGRAYDSNVTGIDGRFLNKDNSYLVEAKWVTSQKYFVGKDVFGHNANASIAKMAGKYRWSASYLAQTPNYDINDLGIQFRSNIQSFRASASINKQLPHGPYIRGNKSLYILHERLFDPNTFNSLTIGGDGFQLLKSWFAYGYNFRIKPLGEHDYFEPRLFDFRTYYFRPASINTGVWISTDYSKPVAVDAGVDFTGFKQNERYIANAYARFRLNLNDKLSIFPEVNVNYSNNDEGRISIFSWAPNSQNFPSGGLLFARRNVLTIRPRIIAKYLFNEELGFIMRYSHNWSYVKHNSFWRLIEPDGNGKTGKLASTNYGVDFNGVSSLHDYLFRFYTIDLNLIYRFRPGSSISLFFTNTTSSSNFSESPNYFSGPSVIYGLQGNVNFGLKFLFFIDVIPALRTADRFSQGIFKN